MALGRAGALAEADRRDRGRGPLHRGAGGRVPRAREERGGAVHRGRPRRQQARLGGHGVDQLRRFRAA